MNFMIDPIKDIKVKIFDIALKSRTTLYDIELQLDNKSRIQCWQNNMQSLKIIIHQNP